METKAPFDLNAVIQRWRENLAQSPAFRAENLAELESHLRDSIARLQTTGLSVDEAFMVAEKRIGHRGILEAEYRKINRQSIWVERFFWMLLGIQLSSLFVNTLCKAGTNALFFSLYKLGYNFTPGNSVISPWELFVAGDLGLFATSIFGCWWLLRRKGEILGRWTARLLRNRLFAMLTFLALFIIPYLIQTAGILFLWPAGPGRTMVVISSSQISRPIQTAALLGLTLYIAAKRLRPGTGKAVA